jgi:all-trans-retinol 13,14-reductase
MPESYKKIIPNKKYDHIIIGSGISGIGLAALLAKQGQSSLILERHYAPGGFTHVFKRRGYEWDVGVHYIGQVHQEKSFIRRLFNYVTDSKLEWAELPDNYDRIIFGEKIYNFYKGKENFKKKLKEYFPSSEDQNSIDAYVDLVREAAKTSRGLLQKEVCPNWLICSLGNTLVGNQKSFIRKPPGKY